MLKCQPQPLFQGMARTPTGKGLMEHLPLPTCTPVPVERLKLKKLHLLLISRKHESPAKPFGEPVVAPVEPSSD